VGGEGSGGGLLSTTSADIRATRFISNFASENGGGAALQIATLTESLFERNVAQQRGGGLAVCCGLTTATRVTFTQNLAAAGGGAIVVESLGSLRLTESTLLRNSASNGAGQALAISQSGGLVYVGNSQIVDESVLSTSDVIRLSGVSSAAQIVNNTVVGNGQGHMIGQIQTSPRAASVINNVIAGFAVGIFGTANNIEVGNNLYFTVPVSRTANVIDLGGSVVADPLFVDAANGNYHIKPASPAVNAGRATDLTIDIDGQQRPWGVAVDIGFDEIDPATIPPPVTPTPPLPPVQKIYVPFVIR
jgi:predicted outer membrane repeat protein